MRPRLPMLTPPGQRKSVGLVIAIVVTLLLLAANFESVRAKGTVMITIKEFRQARRNSQGEVNRLIVFDLATADYVGCTAERWPGALESGEIRAPASAPSRSGRHLAGRGRPAV